MSSVLNNIQSANTSLTKPQIEGILYILKSSPGITGNELIRQTGLPRETLRSFKSSISNRLLDSSDDSIVLKEDFSEELGGWGLKPYKWSFLTYDDPDLTNKVREIRKKYHLEPKRSLDQFFATEQTSVSKVLIMHDRGQLEGKNVALLGDDDFLSIVIGLLNLPNVSVTVFDVDAELLGLIETITKDLGIKNIQTVLVDVRNGIRNQMHNKFDVVVTDPPYTRGGVETFLNSCVELLKKEGTVYFYYGNSFKSLEKTLKIQEVINDFGLVVEDRISNFARYYGAESIGSSSSLYILKSTPFTHPKAQGLLAENIYTFEDHAEEKFPYVDHFTFKINKIPNHIILQKKAVLKLVDEFCASHKLKVVDTKVTQFRGKGLSFTYILSTSNLLVHTWPEYQALHIDLITCSPIYNKETLALTLSELFQTKSIETRKIE